MRFKTGLLILPLLFVAVLSYAKEAAVFHYDDYTKTLKTYVDKGWVDYALLKKNTKDLDSYLNRAAAVKEEDFKHWGKQDQLAFYINLYNGATLRLILDHYPLKSIRDIGNFLKGPWKQEVVPLFGKKITLDHLEHQIIRSYEDPRIHFAANCASVGCPLLLNEAYVGEKLNDQFDHAARVFMLESNKNIFDTKAHTIQLSPIFKWFKSDFEKKSGSVRQYLQKIVPEKYRALLRNESVDLEYTDYDWKLNGIENR